MAKKSSKSTRKSRAKKEQVVKKKVGASKKPATKQPEPVVIAEGSEEPVVQHPPSSATSPQTPLKDAVEAEVQKAETADSVEQMLQPPRSRMLVSAFALGVIVIALIFGAAIIRQQNQERADQSVRPSASAAADEILRSGGKMCTNTQYTNDTNGSTNPQSVGMMLQTNPANNIQTPQTLGGGGSDAAALQGAACF